MYGFLLTTIRNWLVSEEIVNRIDEIEKKQADRFPHLVERLDALEKKVRLNPYKLRKK